MELPLSEGKNLFLKAALTAGTEDAAALFTL